MVVSAARDGWMAAGGVGDVLRVGAELPGEKL